MDKAAITSMLESCLLTEEEMALGPGGWAEALDDELPVWGVEEDHEEEGGEGEDEGESEGDSSKR